MQAAPPLHHVGPTTAAVGAPEPPIRTGYAGFGSFHSDDVEVLIRQDAASYVPPQLPFPDPASQPGYQCGAAPAGRSSSSSSGGTATTAIIRGNSSSSSGSSGSSSNTGNNSSFGGAARQQFLIDFSSWTFINGGAFGGPSRAAYDAAELWRRHCEAQPLRFIDRELFPHLVRVIHELAAFVNCRPQDLVLLPNATTGLNAVISSMAKVLQPGDAVFSLDIGYGSVKKMLQAVCDASGADMVTATVRFPISGPEDIIDLVQQQLPAAAKLAVFDAVTSNTALVLPIQQLVQLCRDSGVPVLIDGAHALGMLPLDLQRLQPDFLVMNCHKWLAGARGSAALFVAPQWQALVQPPVLSHGAAGGLLSRFIWDGCRDYSPLLAISTAVNWWKRLDGDAAATGPCTCPPAAPAAPTPAAAEAASPPAAEADGATHHAQQHMPGLPAAGSHPGDGGGRARAYMSALLRAAADMLTRRWGTECLGPPSMTAAMVLVRLPEGGVLPVAGQADSADAKYVQDVLHSVQAIEVPIKTIQSRLYVRISAHIYNVLQDYEGLAAVIEALARQEQQPSGQASAEAQAGAQPNGQRQ